MLPIILASGEGSRLGELTDQKPKPLVEVCGRPLISYPLTQISKRGINRCIITTGPFRKELEEYARSLDDMKYQFINNERYDETNYSYSLWLAMDTYEEWADNHSVLLLHSDLVFSPIVFDRLITSDVKNGVIVSSDQSLDSKDFCGEIEANSVTRIETGLSGDNVRQIYPMYKLSARMFSVWLDEIDQMIESGFEQEYAEAALNPLLDRYTLRPIYIDSFCSEVDTPDDIETVESNFC